MIYFDQCSTSFPKAPGVSDKVREFIDDGCVNAGRGGYSAAWAVERMVFETRETLAALFGYDNGKNVIFTGGATQSLNMALKGFLKPGDHVLTTVMEHNSVLRPLAQLKKTGVETDFAACGTDGRLSLNDFTGKLAPNTAMVVMTHASNVCGTVMPIKEVGEICAASGVVFVLDAAQTAGVLPIDMKGSKIDVLIFSGHKGLLATQGIGGFIIGDDAAKKTEPLITGGTGSFSHLSEPPAALPDKYEAGTLNLPGVAALNASLSFINQTGLANLRANEKKLQGYFIDEIKKIPGVRLAGHDENNLEESCAVAALDFINKDNGAVSGALDSEYGIMTRCGLHCAPLAHKALGTYPGGAVRCSFGYANTEDEIDYFLRAIKKISREN